MNLHLYPESFVKNQASFYISNPYLLFRKHACTPALPLWRTPFCTGWGQSCRSNPVKTLSEVGWGCASFRLKQLICYLFFLLLKRFLLFHLLLSHHNKQVLGDFHLVYEVLNQSDSQVIKAHNTFPLGLLKCANRSGSMFLL